MMLKADWIQDPPFAIQIEPTEGCNLYCDFCGLQGIREKKEKNLKFMSVDTADMIAYYIAVAGWTSRIEFAMHGEPTLNADLEKIVSTFRKYLKNNQLMVTSNGGGLLSPKGRVEALFAAGLNILALDDYEGVKLVDKVLAGLPSTVHVVRYPQDGLEYSPHRRWAKNTKIVVVLEDISKATEGGHSVLNNHAGAGAPLNTLGAGKRCAKPFRELSIRWDGSVAGCCNDWRGVYKVGKISKIKNVADIWQSPEFQAMRRKLYYGQRDFGACNGCDATSYRVGLLPDKLGKITPTKPTEKDELIVQSATMGGTYSPVVFRPWEKKL